MADLCRICFKPTTIEPDGCPCWGDGSPESELDCFRLGVAHRDAELASALQRAEAAERQNQAWEMMATVTALTTGNARFFRQKDQAAAEWNSTVVIADTYGEAAVDLATKLGLLDAASTVKPTT